jgi:hypothetical protein
VGDSRLLDEYLVMFDGCIHTAEGRLEEIKPTGGLFHNIEEYQRLQSPSGVAFEIWPCF